jgi:GntR family transcriptional regulator
MKVQKPLTSDRKLTFALTTDGGVPIYRQLVNQILAAIARAKLIPGDRLSTIRQVSVSLAINSNTVARAYKELEIRGFLTTQQGTGTFISSRPAKFDRAERDRRMLEFVESAAARADAEGFTIEEVVFALREWN